jgi:hypothetical protein
MPERVGRARRPDRPSLDRREEVAPVRMPPIKLSNVALFTSTERPQHVARRVDGTAVAGITTGLRQSPRQARCRVSQRYRIFRVKHLAVRPP